MMLSNNWPLLCQSLLALFLTRYKLCIIEAFSSNSAFNVKTNKLARSKIIKPFASRSSLLLAGNKDDDNIDDDSWDAGTEYPTFDPDEEEDDFPLNFGEKGLGIDIGKQMGAMSPEEIEELKSEAAEAIETAFAGRLDEIEAMKKQMAKDFEKSKAAMDFASELNAKRESEKLMNKIDAISNKFLAENEALRMGTKQAAAADASMVGRGLEVGSWGTNEDGFAVTTGGVMIGGSNSNSVPKIDNVKGSGIANEVPILTPMENKILIIVDESEKMEKKLVEKFTSLLQTSIPETPIQIETISATKPAPMGGLDAQTAIFFTSALSDRGSIERILDRILTRTAPIPGKISAPPTHLVCVSSLGTERTDKMPYSMQNIFSKKLDKKRGMEEAIVSTIKRRDPEKCPLDYTIIKIGNIVDSFPKAEVEVMEGDSLDGDIALDAAAQILMQSVAFQPPARNATLSAVGGTGVEDLQQKEWDDMFLVLDGPELCRIDIPLQEYGEKEVQYKYERLSEYMQEWADTMFVKKTSGTGLTTPVTVEKSRKMKSGQSGVQILFKQTRTGAAYKSKSEERELERQSDFGSSQSSKPVRDIPMAQQKKEGGLEVIVEMRKALPKEGEGMRLRVRGRRCNMADDTVIKEISEGVLLKRLREGVKYWVEQTKP